MAEEGLWAEPTDSVQAGTLLVATPRAAQRNPRYEQLVVLVLEHSSSRTSGVILNRPSMAVVDDLLGWGCVIVTWRHSQCKPVLCAPQFLPTTQCPTVTHVLFPAQVVSWRGRHIVDVRVWLRTGVPGRHLSAECASLPMRFVPDIIIYCV